jgi:hypothetical protein
VLPPGVLKPTLDGSNILLEGTELLPRGRRAIGHRKNSESTRDLGDGWVSVPHGGLKDKSIEVDEAKDIDFLPEQNLWSDEKIVNGVWEHFFDFGQMTR